VCCFNPCCAEQELFSTCQHDDLQPSHDSQNAIPSRAGAEPDLIGCKDDSLRYGHIGCGIGLLVRSPGGIVSTLCNLETSSLLHFRSRSFDSLALRLFNVKCSDITRFLMMTFIGLLFILLILTSVPLLFGFRIRVNLPRNGLALLSFALEFEFSLSLRSLFFICLFVVAGFCSENSNPP
jgi:hypothetical protein